jgi:hypothetical protein
MHPLSAARYMEDTGTVVEGLLVAFMQYINPVLT